MASPRTTGSTVRQPGITFSTIDNDDFGKGIGDLMADCVNERLDGEAIVIYVGSGEGSTAPTNINEELAGGARRRALPRPRSSRSWSPCTDDVAGTQAVIESALQGNPDSDGLMAGDAESTMAGLNVYSAAGKDPTEICIVGNGGTEDQIAAVEAGELYGVVAFDFVGDLAQNVDELHRLAARSDRRPVSS